jgi:hypothetical protein
MAITPESGVEQEVAAESAAGSVNSLITALEVLELDQALGQAPGQQSAAVAFDQCAPPDTRTAPSFIVPFRRPVFSSTLAVDVDLGTDIHIDPGFDALRFSCVPTSQVVLWLALDLHFQQLWNLSKLSIGDLSSTIGLAPLEELTLEFQSSQRRILEQSSVDSAEQMDSTEATTIDKEAMNTVASASKTENWHVDSSASYSAFGATVSVGGGYSQTTTKASQTSVEHLSEATKKSAHNLKTLHKIEVKGVSETLVSNRMTRKLKNPMRDRTLVINVYEVLKHFSVSTALTEIVPALIIDISSLVFDSDFVVSNTDFLADTLLDPSLIDALPSALQGADPLPALQLQRTREAAKLALHYLFDEPNIFRVPSFPIIHSNIAEFGAPFPPADPALNANSVATSFDAGLDYIVEFLPPASRSVYKGMDGKSGLAVADSNNLGMIFTTLAFFYRVYSDFTAADKETHAIGLASSLLALNAPWSEFVKDKQSLDQIQTLLGNDGLNEVFRRLSGFLAMVAGMVTPLGGTTPDEAKAIADQEKSERVLAQLIQHLNCNRNYYTEKFLSYRAKKTENLAVEDFVVDVIRRVSTQSPQLGTLIASEFDIHRAFCDRRQIVIPGNQSLTAAQVTHFGTAVSGDDVFEYTNIDPAILDDVQVPADGIHIEVAEGSCTVADVPPVPTLDIEASLQAATVSIVGNTAHALGKQ